MRNLENRLIHLTNDAIQKKGEEYGKFESCNKVSFADFEKYLEGSSQEEVDKFNNYTKSQMKEIAKILIESVGEKINPARKQFCFEVKYYFYIVIWIRLHFGSESSTLFNRGKFESLSRGRWPGSWKNNSFIIRKYNKDSS